MNVLQVNSDDLHSRGFGGFDLLDDLQAMGVTAKQAVIIRESRDPRVVPLLRHPLDALVHEKLVQAEEEHSMRVLLFPWGRVLESTAEYHDADVVHYHLIHNNVLSLFDLPRLFASKPSVWTIHDPWAFTGHCIHPRDCQGWLNGCDPCPYLDRLFPMEEDRAHALWALKRRVYAELDVDIVVTSEFMLEMVRRSPLTAHLDRVHVIPLGIDTSRFLPDSQQAASRAALGIPADDVVLLFRSTDSEFKGLPYIIDALGSRPPERPTTLLTLDTPGLLGQLSNDYNIVDLGWIESRALPRALSASDMLLMPSVAESFGLMAVEAMAAGRPVICFEGTAVQSVVHAPECGVAVPMGSTAALREAIDRLTEDTPERLRRGELGRALARERYSRERYLGDLVGLYEEVSHRRRGGA